MKKRILIAGISHETNTYCQGETETSDFYQMRGDTIFRAAGTESSLGGALATCTELDFEIVPVLIVSAQPSGTINFETYVAFKQEILAGIDSAKPIDGVFLELHGAGVVNGIEDLEGDLAQAVRDKVGEAVPITASFDLHGNVTQRMADALDGVFACHQYPHVDMHLRAEEAIRLISRMLAENFRPVIHVETVPMLMPTTTTFEGIGQRMLEFILEIEQTPGVIDVSWFHGFPYTDISHVGSHVVVTTESNHELAEDVARRAATHLWQQRESFRPLSLSAEAAVNQAMLSDSGTVVINETSDNCGGGSPGDGTHLLKAMLDAELDNACFGFIVDSSVAEQAHAAGVGATISVELGAKTDNLHGDPLCLTVYVKALHDGRLIMQAMGKASPLNIGKMARLICNGMDIVVASRRSQTFDPGPFEAVGIDVRKYSIVALKSSNHFRAGFSDVATQIVTADPPGLTTHHIEVFDRLNCDWPMWPVDENANYD
ncbi:MAG: M81 family metallopeptidase [Pseudomonadales bacterium]|nr:M81 family metallopeptidase [Pseudomonadales bacterium]